MTLSTFIKYICVVTALVWVTTASADTSFRRPAMPITASTEQYAEKLTVSPLLDSTAILAHFEFNVTGRSTLPERKEHYTLYPRVLGEIEQAFGVRHAALSMTQGRWRFDEWGVHESIKHSAPAGAEVIVQLDVDDHWAGFVNMLSGLVCGSLNLMTHPARLRDPVAGDVLIGTLPREDVCTENLTPVRKLLPCGTSGGIATLINARELFAGLYYTMRLEFTPTSFYVSLTTVVRADRAGKLLSARDALSKSKQCPSATSSIVDDSAVVHSNQGKAASRVVSAPPLRLTRSASRAGYFDGALVVHMENPSDSDDIHVRYVDIIPWYAKVYLSKVVLHNALTLESYPLHAAPGVTIDALTPAVDHGAPTVIDFTITMPPHAVFVLHIHFDKAFLPWTEYPPDAHAGYSIGVAHVTVTDKQGRATPLYTDGVTIMLPMPDFSMPYNVITLTSTVLALLFGSLVNVLLVQNPGDEK